MKTIKFHVSFKALNKLLYLVTPTYVSIFLFGNSFSLKTDFASVLVKTEVFRAKCDSSHKLTDKKKLLFCLIDDRKNLSFVQISSLISKKHTKLTNIMLKAFCCYIKLY